MRRFIPFIGLMLLLAGCGLHPVARVLAPSEELPLDQTQVRAKARSIDGANEFLSGVESYIKAAYGTEKLICLDLVILSGEGDRKIRPGAPSWCTEAEAIRGALLESQSLVLGQLELWRQMGEEDDMAREQFLVVLWVEYQKTLAAIGRIRAISSGLGF